jgi:transposase
MGCDMAKQYRISIEPDERIGLEQLIKTGTRSALTQRRVRALLLADENQSGGGRNDVEIASIVGVSVATVERTRREYHQRGKASLERKPVLVGPRERKLDARHEAQMIALCCEKPPDGMARWSLRLLADKLVELEVVDAISHETVRQVLQSNAIKPWQKKHWCLPPQEQCRIRLRDGGRPRSLPSASRSKASVGLPRRS